MTTNSIGFKGLPYPIVSDPRGLFYPASSSQIIRSSLLSILLTNQYERVMETDFGANLDSYLFELEGSSVEQAVRDKIIQQIATYEPRVTITNLTVTTTLPSGTPLATGDSADQVLLIQISWMDPQNQSEVQDLTLELPIGGS